MITDNIVKVFFRNFHWRSKYIVVSNNFVRKTIFCISLSYEGLSIVLQFWTLRSSSRGCLPIRKINAVKIIILPWTLKWLTCVCNKNVRLLTRDRKCFIILHKPMLLLAIYLTVIKYLKLNRTIKRILFSMKNGVWARRMSRFISITLADSSCEPREERKNYKINKSCPQRDSNPLFLTY